MRGTSERGAVAVEMAILLPILLLLVLGIVEFGRALNTQITLTHAAREGVRVLAISEGEDWTEAVETAENAAPSLDHAKMVWGSDPGSCDSGSEVTMKITYDLETLTGFFGPLSMTGKGVMRCGG